MELENSRPAAADRGENSRTPQGRKEKRDAGKKNGEETGETRAFSSISSPFFVFSSLLSLLSSGQTQCRWGKRTFFLPDSQLTPTKGERFLEQERKRSCNFLWKFKTLSVYSRCGCPFAASFSQALGQRRRTPAPRLLLTRQIDMRTPAGRPQDPMGWLELRPFF